MVRRLRGRFEAQSADELQDLTGGAHRNGDMHYDEEDLESPAVVRRGGTSLGGGSRRSSAASAGCRRASPVG